MNVWKISMPNPKIPRNYSLCFSLMLLSTYLKLSELSGSQDHQLFLSVWEVAENNHLHDFQLSFKEWSTNKLSSLKTIQKKI